MAPAHAFTPLNAPVPSSAYIVFDNLEWAWGDSTSSEEALDLSYQGSQGWSVATEAELANAPLATDFLKSDGNVPYNGVDPVSQSQFSPLLAPDYTLAMSAGACAAGYFSHYNAQCNFADGDGQAFGPWAGTGGVTINMANDQDVLFVHALSSPGTTGTTSAAPEPTSWALMFAGIAILGAMLRMGRKRGLGSSYAG